jgi:deazaflavin-dependent oxidoreductase (nitroreductase family)
MDKTVKEVMDRGGVADITTVGRKTGQPRRIEINFQQIDGAYYLTGRPGRHRDWLANIYAHPEFILHLKDGLVADVDVVGEQEPDASERERVLRRTLEVWDVDAAKIETIIKSWVDEAPFIRFSPVGF